MNNPTITLPAPLQPFLGQQYDLLESYRPADLLDFLMQRVGLANDAALAHYLHIAPPVVSKVRSKRLCLSDSLIIRIHEVSGLSVAQIKAEAGIPVFAYAAEVIGRDRRSEGARRRAAERVAKSAQSTAGRAPGWNAGR